MAVVVFCEGNVVLDKADLTRATLQAVKTPKNAVFVVEIAFCLP